MSSVVGVVKGWPLLTATLTLPALRAGEGFVPGSLLAMYAAPGPTSNGRPTRVAVPIGGRFLQVGPLQLLGGLGKVL